MDDDSTDASGLSLPELADGSAAWAEELATISRLKGLEHEDRVGSLYWAVAPELALALTGGSMKVVRSPQHLALQSVRRSFIRSAGPKLIRVGPVLVVSTSNQTDRVFAPVIRTLSQRFGKAVPSTLPRLTVEAFRHSHSRTIALRRELGGEGALPEGTNRRLLDETIDQSSILIERARRLMGSADAPSVVMVATQHGAAVRSVLAAINDFSEVTSVYIPHAPVARNAFYADLPVHHAILRGPAEVGVYEAMGAPLSRMSSAGDPSIGWRTEAFAPAGDVLLYALSSEDPTAIQEEVNLIAEACVGEVEVSLHPLMRNRSDIKAMLPGPWRLNPLTSTYDRMASAGFRAVVQRSSGVGLEALGLGLPVIDLCAPGRKPNYHYLTEPDVAIVSSGPGLARALDAAVRTDQADQVRRRLAGEWVQSVGDVAASAIAGEVVRIVEAGWSQSLILDGWRSGS